MGRSLSGLDDRDIADVVDGTRPIAASLRGARILVTGATGWFGVWILDALVALDRTHDLGLSIVAVSRDPSAFGRRQPALFAAGPIEWVTADVRAPLDIIEGAFTHVIHAATDSSSPTDAATPDDAFTTIVDGMTHVLEVVARDAATRMLFVSSGAVYGPQPGTLASMAEDFCGVPDAGNAYAEGKRAAESIAATWHRTHGADVTIARCFAFVGPHMPFDAHFAIGNFVRDAAFGRAIRIAGDGRPRRSYLYMSDLIVALLTILVAGRAMRPYNVGGDVAMTIEELARAVAAAARHPVPVTVVGAAGGRDYVPDTTRIREEMHVRQHVALGEAIARTVAWFDRTHVASVQAPTRVAQTAPC